MVEVKKIKIEILKTFYLLFITMFSIGSFVSDIVEENVESGSDYV